MMAERRFKGAITEREDEGTMTGEAQISEYLDILSSKAPVPGGGGASALAGALGDSLGQMEVHLTLGKKKYAQVQDEMLEYESHLKRLQEEFLVLADRDAEVFAPLAECYRLLDVTEEEKAYKEKIMEERLRNASFVPLEIMEKAVEMLGILEELLYKGSVMAVSDVGVGVQFARTALLGAVMNVYINTRSMKNRQKAEELNGEAERLAKEGTLQADRIYENVLKKLRG